MLPVDVDKNKDKEMNEGMNEGMDNSVIENFVNVITSDVEKICANCGHFIPGFNDDPNKDGYCGYKNKDVNKNDSCPDFYPD